MSAHLTFAILSDPHIALPHTIWDSPQRFHLVEVSIAALEQALAQLEQLPLDFLLIPGDLTQHGEMENHTWLAQRLAQCPYPVYVIPGNHDILQAHGDQSTAGISDFICCYQSFGYGKDLNAPPYYCREVSPGVWLLGLNSIAFEADGQQAPLGQIDAAQMAWLERELAAHQDETLWVMIHHNVIEHLPGQAQHVLGKRYMLANAPELLARLQRFGVKLIFTGHLHVQDVATCNGIYEITTGSLVSYPHPYRVVTYEKDEQGQAQVQVKTRWVTAVPDFPNLQDWSRQWLGDRSFPFMVKFLTHPPLNVEIGQAEAIAPLLRDFWAEVAYGDAWFNFPDLPPQINAQIQRFGAVDAQGNPARIDNQVQLQL